VAVAVVAQIIHKVLVTTTVAVAGRAAIELQQVLPFLLAFLLL
jgi:hypothetical protein